MDTVEINKDLEKYKISEVDQSIPKQQQQEEEEVEEVKQQNEDTLNKKKPKKEKKIPSKSQKQEFKSENDKNNKTQQDKKKAERKKPIEQIQELNFLPIGSNGSEITIWHRPTNAHINLLKSNLNVSLIVSLQGEREHVSEIKNSCDRNGIQWFNIPLEGANETLLSSNETRLMIQSKLTELKDILTHNKHKAVLHCAAGIHRTGTVTYSLLRLFGDNYDQAMQKLQLLREFTFQQVGDHRIQIAEKYFVQPIIDIVNPEQKQ